MRVSFVNLFYPPDLAPSAHLAASVAEHRAELGDQVTVVCGRGTYLGGSAEGDRAEPPRRARRSPKVIRLWTPALGKANTSRRLGDYLSFLIGATVRLATLPRQDVVVVLTTPPYILVAGVVHRLLHPRARVVLWSHDVYPDAAEVYGTIRRGGVASRVLRGIERWLFRSVDHVVAVDPVMLQRVLSGYAHGGRPTGSVIPTWEPLSLFPADAAPERWGAYADLDLAERFIVLHLGNLGYGHRTETIVDAASRLADTDVTFLFVGGGVRFPELAEAARRRGVRNVAFRDYVPKDETPGVLAGAACSLISLDDRSLGIMSPCKMNGSLAMGLPIVYAGPVGSTVDEAIATYGCGFSLRHDDVDGLVAAIRRLHDDPGVAAGMARHARRAFEETFSDRSALPRFDAVLDGAAGKDQSNSERSSQPLPGVDASPC